MGRELAGPLTQTLSEGDPRKLPEFGPQARLCKRRSAIHSRITSAALRGVEAYLIEVEVDLAGGLPTFIVGGLPDAAVMQSQGRVRAALRNSGFEFPSKAVTVNLAPAHLPKQGPSFDLPIALAILAAGGHFGQRPLPKVLILGELGLDGGLRPVRGVLPSAMAAKRRGLAGLMVPSRNAAEATLVEDLGVYPVTSLPDAVEKLAGGLHLADAAARAENLEESLSGPDLAEVRGQAFARRALEIAAAGGHNLLMLGPPGSGKSMLAQRLPSILPTLDPADALEVACAYSVAGQLDPGAPLPRRPPFRAPHHTTSVAGLVGGGSLPRPGELALAHRGVLFLDELPEFTRSALEALRQPLESGHVILARASGCVTFPAQIQLIAAMNPCPCGYLGDPRRPCTCPPSTVQRYRGRISGPLIDRFDLAIEVPAVAYAELRGEGGEESATVRQRVEAARERQRRRLGEGNRNAELSSRDLGRWAKPDAAGEALLEQAMQRLGLSARGLHRVQRVARTIADLAGRDRITPSDLAEAISYRALDRRQVPS